MSSQLTNIRILLIDDHVLFAEGLKATLRTITDEENILIVRDIARFLRQLCHQSAYDLVIVDLHMPDIDGMDVIRKLSAHNNQIPILVVSASKDSSAFNRAMEIGASGFVSKSSEVSVIIRAVKTLLSGNRFMDPSFPSADASLKKTAENQFDIPPRTREVLNQMARGHTNKMIADLLSITEPTVKWHVTQLFDILSAKSRTACVTKAAQYGLVEISE